MSDTDTLRPWFPAAQDSMPAMGQVVEIDVGSLQQSMIHRAWLVLDAAGHWWVIDGNPERLPEPRIVNRLAHGRVWRWRARER